MARLNRRSTELLLKIKILFFPPNTSFSVLNCTKTKFIERTWKIRHKVEDKQNKKKKAARQDNRNSLSKNVTMITSQKQRINESCLTPPTHVARQVRVPMDAGLL